MCRLPVLRISALGLLLGVLFPVAVLAQPSSGPITLSDTVAFDRAGTVEIKNQEGSITVTTWDRAQVGYEVTLEPSEGDSVVVPGAYVNHTDNTFSFGLADSWSFEIPGLLTISPTGTSNPTAHYRVTMPKTAELQIDDHASTTEVSGPTANLEIDTHKGDATVDSLEGTLELDTHEGTIEATALRGGVELDTHDGTIAASFDQFTAASTAETHSGSLRVFLPADTGFELQLDLDEENLVVDEGFDEMPSSDEEHRVYNGGGPTLEIESFSGRVEVRAGESLGASSP